VVLGTLYVDGVSKVAISDFSNKSVADHEDSGIEANVDQATFRSGTSSYNLQYQDPSSTNWFYWASPVNVDANNFGWSSTFSETLNSNSPTTVFTHS